MEPYVSILIIFRLVVLTYQSSKWKRQCVTAETGLAPNACLRWLLTLGSLQYRFPVTPTNTYFNTQCVITRR